MKYLVTWEIDIEADTPLDAALMAEDIQLNQASDRLNGGVFKLVDENHLVRYIDLQGYYHELAEKESQA